MTNFWRKNVVIFHDIKKIGIYFSFDTFVSYIRWLEDFFQEHVEIEL